MATTKNRKARYAGTMGAYARITKPGYDARAATRPATEARIAEWEARIDPDGRLEAEARRKAANKAMMRYVSSFRGTGKRARKSGGRAA